jgi:hypothetical protein
VLDQEESRDRRQDELQQHPVMPDQAPGREHRLDHPRRTSSGSPLVRPVTASAIKTAREPNQPIADATCIVSRSLRKIDATLIIRSRTERRKPPRTHSGIPVRGFLFARPPSAPEETVISRLLYDSAFDVRNDANKVGLGRANFRMSGITPRTWR